MVRVTLYVNAADELTAFRLYGHAGFDEAGSDIVCAAISVLTINTINAVDVLTDARWTRDEDGDAGYMEFHLKDTKNAAALLLLKAYRLGMEQIRDEYGEYLEIMYEEVTR
ncbi:MAG: ribosomal-processing cysteine protease Prp [Eubacteriales bacterium]|nr:ribosomal-processing cysteine protease Prp [Eubacteriales bacterium]